MGATSVPETTTTNNLASASLAALIPDVSVTLDLPASGIAGGTALATVTFANVGSGTASAVIGTTTLSNGQIVTVNLGTLTAGTSTTTFVVVTIPSAGILSGTSTVATSTPEITLSNNTSSDSLVINQTEISTTVALPTTAQVGTTVTATIAFQNTNGGHHHHLHPDRQRRSPARVSAFVTAGQSRVLTVSVTTLGASVSGQRGQLPACPRPPPPTTWPAPAWPP